MAGPYSSGNGTSITVVAIVVSGVAVIVGSLIISSLDRWLKLLFLCIWTALFACFVLYVVGFFGGMRRKRSDARRRRRWMKEAPGLLTLLYSVIDSMRRIISAHQSGAFPQVVTQVVNAYPPSGTPSYAGNPVIITMGQFPGIEGSFESFSRRLQSLERRRNAMNTNPRLYATCMENELGDIILELINLYDEYGSWSDGIFKKLVNLGAKCSPGSVQRSEFDAYRTNVSSAASKLQELSQEANSIARRIGVAEIAPSINKKYQDDFF